MVSTKISAGKDSELVKELYAAFDRGDIAPNLKPAEYCKQHMDLYGRIDSNSWRNAFNKAKAMFVAKTPPTDIGKSLIVVANMFFLVFLPIVFRFAIGARHRKR